MPHLGRFLTRCTIMMTVHLHLKTCLKKPHGFVKKCLDYRKLIHKCSPYAAFRGLSSAHKSLTWQPRASAIALRQYRDLVMPLIVWWIVTRCRLHLRPISAADKPFFHISVLIFNSMSNMYLLYSHTVNYCQEKTSQKVNYYYEVCWPNIR